MGLTHKFPSCQTPSHRHNISSSESSCGIVSSRHKIANQEKELFRMESLKEEVINVISKLPDSADIDDIMYRLYVIDKIRKGREAVKQGETMSIEDLKREMASW